MNTPPITPVSVALANECASRGFHRIDAQAYAVDGIRSSTEDLQPGQFALANDSRFNQAFFSQPLTAYAVGWRDASIDSELEFFAPQTPVSRYFQYATCLNVEEFYSELYDDLRAIGGDFKRVEYKSTKVAAKTENRGLTLRVDLDEVGATPDWERNAVAKLLRRLKRNSLRRAIALLSAAAVNTAKTWDTTAGKDPDQDVISELITAQNVIGVADNRVGYGDTAWSKRMLAHRAQASSGGFASASMTPEEVASWLGVDQVLRSKARYQSSSSAKSEIVSNLVLMFNAQSGQSTEDASHIKRFVTPASGGDVDVYSQQVGPKLYDISVSFYELIKITFTSGIRKFTVS